MPGSLEVADALLEVFDLESHKKPKTSFNQANNFFLAFRIKILKFDSISMHQNGLAMGGRTVTDGYALSAND